MGLGGFFKGLAKGVGSAVGRPLRGIGRVMRGNFREGFADIGHGIKRGAQAAALLGSGGLAAPAIAAGGGMLERGLSENASLGNVLGAGVGGASGAMAARGVGNIGRSMLKRGAGATAGQASSGGVIPSVSRAERTATALGQTVSSASGGGAGGGIGGALRSGASFLEEHPTSVTFAGNLLSGTGYDQGDYYQDLIAQRREEEEYDRSREKMLRDMILSGAWRS